MKKDKGKNKIPVILINITQRQSWQSLFVQTVIRFFLLCLVTIGTCLVTAQTYRVPVDETRIISVCIIWSIIFNVLFVLLKFRFSIPVSVFIIAFNYIEHDNLFNSLSCIKDYFLLKLDSRMLFTSQFAERSLNQLREMPDDFLLGIQEGFIFICIVVSLVYALAGRGRFIGSVLITLMIVIIPAFGAEIATFCSGMFPLLLGMFGLYSIWSSHEHHLNNISNSSVLRELNPTGKENKNKQKNKTEKRKGFIFAGAPRLRQHGINGIIAVFISLAAYITSTSILPEEKTEELLDYVNNLNAVISDTWLDVMDNIRTGFSDLQHSGYFPVGEFGSSSISSSLSINAPTISTRAVMNVTREDISEPVFLKAGIGVKLNDEKFVWEVDSNNTLIQQLNELIKLIYPEYEYLVYRQKLSLLGNNPDNFIGLQQVGIEYLISTRYSVLPTFPYMPNYKSSGDFNWNLDTVIKDKSGFFSNQLQTWEIIYPKVGRNEFNSKISEVNKAFDIDVNDIKELAELFNSEHSNYMVEYKKLVEQIYTTESDREASNIKRLKREMIQSEQVDFYEYKSNQPQFVKMVTDYFKNNYSYSLVTDNDSGENTTLGNFLFDTRSGHCALYATAMTLFLRSEGIPARYVTGYVVNGGGVTADGNYLYTVLERDLHAWVEVYYDDIGWVPYDPTPAINESVFEEAYNYAQGNISSVPAQDTQTQPNTATTTSQNSITSTTQSTENASLNTETNISDKSEPVDLMEHETESKYNLQIYVIVILAILIILIAFVIFLVKSVIKSENKKIARFGSVNNRLVAREIYAFTIKLLGMEGYTTGVGELPFDFARRVDEAFYFRVKLSDVMGIFEKLEFSREDLTEEECAMIGKFSKELYKKAVLEKRFFTRTLRRLIINNIL